MTPGAYIVVAEMMGRVLAVEGDKVRVEWRLSGDASVVPRADVREARLIDVLDGLGYSSMPAERLGQKRILRDGEIMFTGRAHEVWEWLRKVGDL